MVCGPDSSTSSRLSLFLFAWTMYRNTSKWSSQTHSRPAGGPSRVRSKLLRQSAQHGSDDNHVQPQAQAHRLTTAHAIDTLRIRQFPPLRRSFAHVNTTRHDQVAHRTPSSGSVVADPRSHASSHARLPRAWASNRRRVTGCPNSAALSANVDNTAPRPET